MLLVYIYMVKKKAVLKAVVLLLKNDGIEFVDT